MATWLLTRHLERLTRNDSGQQLSVPVSVIGFTNYPISVWLWFEFTYASAQSKGLCRGSVILAMGLLFTPLILIRYARPPSRVLLLVDRMKPRWAVALSRAGELGNLVALSGGFATRIATVRVLELLMAHIGHDFHFRVLCRSNMDRRFEKLSQKVDWLLPGEVFLFHRTYLVRAVRL